MADDYVITFPLFTYRNNANGGAGFLRDPSTQTVFAPFWSDEDLFTRFIAGAGLHSKTTGVVLPGPAETRDYIRELPDNVRHVTLDASHTAPSHMPVWDLRTFLDQLDH